MPDLASLTLAVNSQGVTSAAGALKEMTAAGRLAEQGASSLGSTFSRIMGTLATMTGGLLSIGAAFKALAIDSQQKSLEMSLGRMLGSIESGKKAVQELRDLSGNVPFSFDGLAETAKTLAGLGTTAKELPREMKAIADAVAGIGGDNSTLERISTSLGRIREDENFTAMDVRRLVTQGIPAWDMLAQNLGVTVPEAMRRAKEGTINFQVAYEGLIEGFEKHFGGASEDQINTFLGAWQVFKNKFLKLWADVGDALSGTINWNAIFSKIATLLTTFTHVFTDALRIVNGGQAKFKDTADSAQKLADVLKILGDILKIVFAVATVAILSRMVIGIIQFALNLKTAVNAASPLLGTIIAVGVALAAWTIGETLFNQFEEVRSVAISIVTALQKADNFFRGSKVNDQWKAAYNDQVAKYGGDANLAAQVVALDQLRKTGMVSNYTTSPKQLMGGIRGQENAQQMSTADQATFDARVAGIKSGNFDPANQFLDMLGSMTLKSANADANNDKRTFSEKLLGNFKDNTSALGGSISDFTGGIMGSLMNPELKKGMDDAKKTLEQLTDSRNQDAAATQREMVPLQQMMDVLQQEQKYMGLTNFEKEKAQTLDKAQKLLDGTSLKNKDQILQGLRDQITLNAQLNTQGEISRTIQQRLRDSETAGLVGDELQKELAYRQLINKAVEEGIPLNKDYLEEIKKQSDAIEDYKIAWGRAQDAAKGVGEAFSSSFTDAITGAKSFKEAFLDMLKAIDKAIIDSLVSKPMGQGITGFFANILGQGIKKPGGTGSGETAFEGSGLPTGVNGDFGGETSFPVTMSAAGNVFERPSLTSIAERGQPEGVFPLFRGSDGKLGVRTSGAQRNITVNQYISTPNADSFRKSSRQVADSVKRGISR